MPSEQATQEQFQSTLSIFSDLILENHAQKQLEICEIFTKSHNFLNPLISLAFSHHPFNHAHVTSMSTEEEISKLKMSEKDEANCEIEFDNIVVKSSPEELVPEKGQGQADVVFLDDSNLLKNIVANLKEKSWVVMVLKSSMASENSDFSHLGLRKISHDSVSKITLLRKVSLTKLTDIRSICIDTKDFEWLPGLKSLLSACNGNSNSRVYLYSQSNPLSGITALTKCLAREGNQNVRCIFDPQGSLELDFKNPSAFLHEVIEADLLQNVVKNGEWGSYRHLPMHSQWLTQPTKNVEHASVNILTVGDLSSLRWIESPLKHVAKEQLYSVNYAALNLRDIMHSTGKLSLNWKGPRINSAVMEGGFEFSGKDHLGNKVMGIEVNSLATSICSTPFSMIWPVPEPWSMEEAATVPIAYTTAYYALVERGRMEPGQSVLIHCGTGGVGQAAINVALSMNCEVFTTVGTQDKRACIQKLFPSLKESHIGNTRDCTFEEQILSLTDGKGVDLVLNSLGEEKFQASLNCMAADGKFLEIGKLDILKNSALGMENLGRNVDVVGVDISSLLRNNRGGKENVFKLVSEGIRKGVVKPLEITVFEKERVEDAFRYMAAGKHVGKVLIQVQKEQDGSAVTVPAIGRSYFRPDKSYVIIGGLGGFGLELSNWLVERGAKHIILLSRGGVRTGYQQLCIQRWKKLGILVETPTIDLTDFPVAEQFIKSHSENGREIGGIFNSSLVLRDALFENQTREMFEAVAAPKVKVTRIMDQLSRKYCPSLDYFVAISSLSAGLGYAGQSNYGLANSEMEQIINSRKEAGLHAVAIQWGVIGDVGYVADNMEGHQISENGVNPQRISSCLQTLDAILEQSKDTNCATTCFSSMVITDKVLDQKESTKVSLSETVARLCSTKTAVKNIAPTTTLGDLGLDSISGKELEQLLLRDYDYKLSSVKIHALTWADIKSIEEKTLNPLSPSEATKEASGNPGNSESSKKVE